MTCRTKRFLTKLLSLVACMALAVALVPAGGTYTMDAREAAAFVNALRPAVAIPEHYGTVAGSADDGKTFAGLVDSGIEVVLKL